MPYKSIKQERWAHTPEGMKALGGPSAVAEWDAASKGKKLPTYAGKGVLSGAKVKKKSKRKSK